MAGSSDRTEQPTPKRLRDARKKGEVARSHAVAAVAATACAIAVLHCRWPSIVSSFRGSLALAFRPERGALETATAAVTPFGADLVLLAAAPALAAAAAMVVQTGLVFAPERLKPDAARFNPGETLKRIFGVESLGSTLVALCGTVSVSGAALWILGRAVLGSAALARSNAPLLQSSKGLFAPALWNLLVVAAAFAAIDWLWRRHRHRKGLLMTKQEVRDEHRESEGDPLIKSQRRRLHRQIAMASLKSGVRTAKVLLVNPTHLAVALRYEGGDDAPVVAYKGEGHVALKMRVEAEDAGVPVVENVPLARAIYFSIEVEEEIPPALYQAVAEVFNAAVRAAADVTTVQPRE